MKLKKSLIYSFVASAVTLQYTAQAQSTWNGATSTDWNDATNWSAGVPGGNAIISTTPANVATISATISATPVDLLIGDGGGTNGSLLHTAGNAQTGNGNWMIVGRNGGTGNYTLSGTGAMTVGNVGTAGRLYVGANGTGTVEHSSSGALIIRNDLIVGEGNGTGTVTQSAGTMTTGGWNFIGNGNGATGTYNQSGGSFTNTGRTYVGGRNAGGTNSGVGNYNISGGTNTTNDTFSVGSGNLTAPSPSTLSVSGTGTLNTGTMSVAGAANDVNPGKGTGSLADTGVINVNGEFWVGQGAGSVGSFIQSAGTMNVNNWVAVGRDTGTGSYDLTGGTFNKTGGGNFIIGASGPGTMTISGSSLLNVSSGVTWLGENGSGTTSLSGTAEWRTSQFILGVNGGGTGTANFNGGSLKTALIDGGGGAANVTFNGTQVIATATALPFISDLDTAVIDAGGLKIDSAGFNLTSAQVFTGTGGVIKSGAGILTLTGASTYTGEHAVNGGTLNLTTAVSSAGGLSVAGNATLGVKVLAVDQGLVPSSVTLSTADPKTLNLDLGTFGNPLSTGAPIRTTGALDVNGVTTFNITATGLTVGQFPLISYGSKTGSGSFQLGTLPPGVVATIVDSGTSIDLNISSASSYEWEGSVAGQVWDVNTTANWYNAATATPAQVYVNGGLVTFNNIATGFAPVLNVTVAPSSVVINNDLVNPYTLSGSGAIGGIGGLTKRGAGNATISLANTYTGATVLEAGTLTVNTLLDGGVASTLGASSSASNNLVFAGGTLAYTGAATTTNRGFIVAAADSTILSGINISNNLTISGQLTVGTVGRIMKSGAGVLTLTNPGANVLALNGDDDTAPSYMIAEGGLALVGGGTQTNTLGGQFRLGTAATNTTTLTLDNSNLTVNGPSMSSLGDNSVSTLTIGGTSVYQSNGRFNMGYGANSVSNIIVKDSGTLNKDGGWLSVGNSSNSQGFMTVQDNATVVSNNDFNVSDVDNSKGTLNVSGNASITSNGAMFIGKGANTVGELNLTGGTITANGWFIVGRYGGTAQGTANISGGTLTQVGDGNLYLGEEGIGVMNVSGTGVVDVNKEFRITRGGGTGTLNLNGGTVKVHRLQDEGGTSTVNFNGGLLQAKSNNTAFIAGLDNAFVLAGGALIDSNGFDIAASQAFSGEGNLSKLGAGKLTLSAFHLYTGDTVVSAGTLSLAQDYIDDLSDVVIATGATMELTHSKTDVVASLTINGAGVTGEWGAIGSGAQNESAAITGSGRLRVGAAVPYIAWAEDKSLDNSNNGLELDPDGDGIANLLEYFLNGDPKNADSVILPSAADSTATDFVLKFKRRDDANGDVTVQEFQYSLDLVNWADLPIPTAAGTTSAGPATITVVANGTDPDDITVTIPKGVNTKMFGRISTED